VGCVGLAHFFLLFCTANRKKQKQKVQKKKCAILLLYRRHGLLVVWDWYLHFFLFFHFVVTQEPRLVNYVGLVPLVCQEPLLARRARRGGRHLRHLF
jgi:hypothetical protein